MRVCGIRVDACTIVSLRMSAEVPNACGASRRHAECSHLLLCNVLESAIILKQVSGAVCTEPHTIMYKYKKVYGRTLTV